MHPKSIAALVVTTVLVLTTIQYSVANSDSTISACADKNSGSLRLLGAAKKCKKTEKSISWNQKGIDGQDADSSIYLSASEFTQMGNFGNNRAEWTSYTINGAVRYGLTYHYIASDEYYGYSVNFAIPENWNSENMSCTFYWIARGLGEADFVIGGDTIKASSGFTVLTGNGSLTFDPEQVDVLQQTTVDLGIDSLSEIANLQLMRQGRGENLSDIIFIGVKISPN